MHPLQVSVVIDSQAITAFGVMVVAILTAYSAMTQRQVAKKVEEVAVSRQEEQVLAQDTNTVTHEVHTLTNSGMTDIKAQLATALERLEQSQIALATANERLTQQPGGETLS